MPSIPVSNRRMLLLLKTRLGLGRVRVIVCVDSSGPEQSGHNYEINYRIKYINYEYERGERERVVAVSDH